MRKLLSLVLALAMLFSVVPAFASSGSEGGLGDLLGSFFNGGTASDGDSSEASGLGVLLGSFFNGGTASDGDSSEASGLGDLLGSIMAGAAGGQSDDSGLGALLSLFGGEGQGKLSRFVTVLKTIVLQKLSSSKSAAKVSEIVSALMGKLSGNTRSAEGAGIEAAPASAGQDDAGYAALIAALLGAESGAGEGGEGLDMNQFLGALFTAGMAGDSEGADMDLDKMLEEYYNSPAYQDELAKRAAVEAYILEEYKDMEAGDVQFPNLGAGLDSAVDEKTHKFLCFLSLTNYTLDGKNLKMKNYAGNPELVVVTKNADGTYSVTEAIPAKDGEAYLDSLKEMAQKYGIDVETAIECLSFQDWSWIIDMSTFLRDHEEYEKVEFQGELKTADELDAIAKATLEASFAADGLSE